MNDGGPAFPRGGGTSVRYEGYKTLVCHHPPDNGMTIRTWLAGMLAAGIYANPACKKMNVEDVALKAYQGADAMLAEGEKNQA